MLAAIPSTFAGGAIDVSVEVSPNGIVVANATIDQSANLEIALPGPGTYVVRYTSGPKKGEVITTVRAAKGWHTFIVLLPWLSAAK